jgi:hypothetical protein
MFFPNTVCLSKVMDKTVLYTHNGLHQTDYNWGKICTVAKESNRGQSLSPNSDPVYATLKIESYLYEYSM